MNALVTVCQVGALALVGAMFVVLGIAAWCWIAEEYVAKREEERLREHFAPIANALSGDGAKAAGDWRSWARQAAEIHELPEARSEAWR